MSFQYEKAKAQEKGWATPYDLPIPKYCRWPKPEGGHCGGELHVVTTLHGEPVKDSRGNPTSATVCETCGNIVTYETGGASMPRDSDARKRARELAMELGKTGLLIDKDGTQRRITVKIEGKHFKVRAADGAFIYSFSSTPSDIRSLQNTESQLRQLNVVWGEEAAKAAEKSQNGSAPEQTEEKDTGALTELQERAIAVRARLWDLREQLQAPYTDLVRIGMDAAEKRGTWKFKNEGSAITQIRRFLGGQEWGSEGALEFYETLCDALESTPQQQEAQPAAAPEPAREPESKLTPASRQVAELTEQLEFRDNRIAEFAERVEQLTSDNQTLEQKLREAHQVNDRQAGLVHEIRGKLDAQRSETLSAQAMVRQLQQLQDERETSAAPAVASDDPLYIKALKRLTAAATTDEEIEEAFQMAQEIAKAGL